MAKSVETTLQSLLKLQAVDCELDRINNLRGTLPEEVGEIEDDLKRLKTNSQNIQKELAELEQFIAAQRAKMKEIEDSVKKYETQQINVRNNREYDAITKEIDLQKLEIQLAEKRIKSAYESIDHKKLHLEQNHVSIEKMQQVLTSKQKTLMGLIQASEEEEKKFQGQRNKILQRIDEHLQKAYEQIRASVRNKLAVVIIDKESCRGCFSKIPSQSQIEIKEKKKIVECEHCGRIIADVVGLVATD